jgi:hypothetical protein
MENSELKDFQIINRAVASQYSYLCRIFQENQLNVLEKQEIIKSCMNDYKKQRISIYGY